MDQVKIGAFIAALRREKGWTQEELGERVGVTNKTVSRWENGNYMPGIEILSLLSREFSVSLNELVQGQRLEGAEFRTAADQNLASALERPFDRLRQWLRRNYMAVIIISLLCVFLAAVCNELLRYRKAHPVDVSLPGTFACKDVIYQNRFTWIYFTFDRNGRYYVFDASGERFEHGRYTLDGDAIALDDGEAVRWIDIKGKQIHDEAPWGGELLTYDRVGAVPYFVNCGPEDFEE